jgi:hypothetical protein
MNPFHLSKDIRLYQRESSLAFQLHEDGWVFRRNVDGLWRRMCWLPYKRRSRGVIHACHGQRVVIDARGGLITILDFSDV